MLCPAQRHIRSFPLQDLQLPVGCRCGGEICYERRLCTGRYGYGNGIGAQHLFLGKGGRYQRAGIGHGNPCHILLQCHHRVIPGYAEMVAVPDGYPACTGGGRFSNSYLHSERSHYQPQSPVPVHQCGGRCFVDDADIRCAVDTARFPQAHVSAQPGNAMAVHASQVCRQQHFRCCAGVLVGAAYLNKSMINEMV